jgi:hypothetical protein
MASEHAVMDLLFRASAFETSDHLLVLSAVKPGQRARDKLKIDSGRLPGEVPPDVFARLRDWRWTSSAFEKDPQSMLSLYAGMLSPLLTIAPRAHDRRESLLGMHRLFEGLRADRAVMPTLCDAYMYTSYGSRRDKHDAKATIHGLFAGSCGGQHRAHVRDAPVRKDRPTILVCLDWFNSEPRDVPLLRPIIKQLRKRFRLVAMSSRERSTSKARPSSTNGNRCPSKGWYWPIIEKHRSDEAGHRLLPVCGNGAVVGGAGFGSAGADSSDDPGPSREQPVSRHGCRDLRGRRDRRSIAVHGEDRDDTRGAARYVMRATRSCLRSQTIDDHPEVIKIAVPAMLCKLNAPFMAA